MPRGGPRKGAGRKAADGAMFLSRHAVMLDHETLAKLRALGLGNLSAGIRRVTRLAEVLRFPGQLEDGLEFVVMRTKIDKFSIAVHETVADVYFDCNLVFGSLDEAIDRAERMT